MQEFARPFVTAVYFDRAFNTSAVKIGPGEYHATDRDLMIVTLLGSCVSVCLRDRQLAIGGMNHFMLPLPAGGLVETIGAPARYGAFAMELLINQLLKLGALRSNLEAKVFGGGRILEGMTDIGRVNGEFAIHYLQLEGISILASDLGDIYPRKVYFAPRTGRVFVRQLKSLRDDTVVRLEQAYLERLKNTPVAGDVELF